MWKSSEKLAIHKIDVNSHRSATYFVDRKCIWLLFSWMKIISQALFIDTIVDECTQNREKLPEP